MHTEPIITNERVDYTNVLLTQLERMGVKQPILKFEIFVVKKLYKIDNCGKNGRAIRIIKFY
jgi:hypothetical protein